MAVQIRPSYRIRSTVSESAPDSLIGTDLAFVGTPVDDRGDATSNQLLRQATYVREFRFDASAHTLHLDRIEIRMSSLVEQISGKKRILLDATTLGLGEILHLLQAAIRSGLKEVEFLYAEPRLYTRIEKPGSHAQERDFALTTNCKFSSVQGFALEYDPARMATHVFMLGYEPARMLNAIEQRRYEDDAAKPNLFAIVGVPAFQAGWDANSIRPHLRVLDENEIRENSISYAQANSIREAYLTLWSLYRTVGDERSCFFVSPLGTKPHSVAAALFLLETKGADEPTSLYYDHPQRVRGRSHDVANWHHVVVQITK